MTDNFVYGVSLLIAFVLQTAIFSQAKFISGSSDLILLVLAAWSLQEKDKISWLWSLIIGLLVSFVSATPFLAPLISYFLLVVISKMLQKRVWQVPLLAMFLVVFIGTVVQHAIYALILIINRAPISLGQSLDSIVLPSILLNLLFSLPVYAIINDLSGRIYPQEAEL